LKLNISHIEEQSFIYGPGSRFVIWVQGCSIKCKGCWNKEMWSFKPKKMIDLAELRIEINQVSDNIEGVTILGGEPLDQYPALLELAKMVNQLGLSFMLFTGYELTEIKENGYSELFEYTDILITGRYIEAQRTLNHQWIGSNNQQIHFLTERYSQQKVVNRNYIEIEIDEFGAVTTLGFPSEEW
jgi:anaerobic ribonucleoside-triphosphate reductase activating protein